MQAVGTYALPLRRDAMKPGYDGDKVGPDYAIALSAGYLNMRKLSIYGGSNEIQKNIIAQMILGL
jgi:alkylation response protein AidB-like acyl-CoA dehydrogenase